MVRLANFYRDVLGFRIVVEEADYVEFDNSGVRLAICSTPLMADNTNAHPSFLEERRGQSFEFNFQCDSPEEVRTLYQEYVSKGATAIMEPKEKHWGHVTSFFADPDGNIHSLFAVIPESK
ncbi:Glyoxalase-like domain protein [compost metagenome]